MFENRTYYWVCILKLDTLAGCSSLGGGALLEHGPFKINGEVLIKNHYSWNTGHFPLPLFLVITTLIFKLSCF